MSKLSLVSFLLFLCISGVKAEAGSINAENTHANCNANKAVMFSAIPRNSLPLLAVEPIQLSKPATPTGRPGYLFNSAANRLSMNVAAAVAITSSFYIPVRWPFLNAPGYFFTFHQFW